MINSPKKILLSQVIFLCGGIGVGLIFSPKPPPFPDRATGVFCKDNGAADVVMGTITDSPSHEWHPVITIECAPEFNWRRPFSPRPMFTLKSDGWPDIVFGGEEE